ncbi:546_t:CDS:2, partial [Entrophospora sp. SA101]
DDKEIKRIFSLEQRVAELENQLLRASASALEKRVKELEFSLKESNEEC